MKSLYLLILLALVCNVAAAQAEQPPYQQTKSLPVVKLLSADSTGWELKAKHNRKKPVMIVVFSPECEHCQHETEELIKNIGRLKHIQIIMATPLPLNEMKAFIKDYNLSKYKNILVGRDYAYVLPVFFGIKNLPYHAFYNKAGQLISGFEGSMSVDKILQILPNEKR